MRQRVAIARTLILRPRIILMDEPFGALDPQTRMNMQDLLVSLWREVAGHRVLRHPFDRGGGVPGRSGLRDGQLAGHDPPELEVEPADRPARLMQREPRFQETVNYIRDLISQLEKQVRTRITA